MKTVLSLQSQLDLAGLEGSSVTTFSMFFQVSILDMLFSATKCLQIAFLSNFGSPLGPWGVSFFLKKALFSSLFSALGPVGDQMPPGAPPRVPRTTPSLHFCLFFIAFRADFGDFSIP